MQFAPVDICMFECGVVCVYMRVRKECMNDWSHSYAKFSLIMVLKLLLIRFKERYYCLFNAVMEVVFMVSA